MPGSLSSYIIRLITALLIGGIIGLEREFKGKPAGMRTNMLICIGSCLVMIISLEIARFSTGSADPGRIAAQVVTGVGFLGAGTIMRSRHHVVGLTTAATIWVLSAIGLATGAGYLALSIIAAALITSTLVVIGLVEERLETKRSFHTLQVSFDRREKIFNDISRVFDSLDIRTDAAELSRTDELWKAIFEYSASQEKHRALLEKLESIEGFRNAVEL